jgi:predicted dehydrogenase
MKKKKGKAEEKIKLSKLLTIEKETANLPLLHLDHRLLDEQKLGDVQIGEISYHRWWDPQISIQWGIESCKDLSLPA